jgi:hypothetical protein
MIRVADRPNALIASALYRASREPASLAEIRHNKTKRSKLANRIWRMQEERSRREQLYREVESALKNAEQAEELKPDIKERIRAEIKSRKDSLDRATETLRQVQDAHDALDRRVLAQESYFCRSQLLDYLHSQGRYAIKPRPLAKALAGLPYMKWRQSHVRCTGMQRFSEPQEWYRTFTVIRKIWGPRRREDYKNAPFDLFQDSILRLPKKSYVRTFLAANWRDLKHAIEESWKDQHPSESIPFIVTANFVRNVNHTKNHVELVLAAQEKLIPS